MMVNEKRELIDRKQIVYTWWKLPNGKFSDGVVLQSVIQSMPTVDAVEVVHGRWNVEHEESIRCSECCFNRAHLKIPMDYCPSCGAKMDGDT